VTDEPAAGPAPAFGGASSPWILWDGELREAGSVGVSPLDRTVLYGLGAFETVRLFAGRPFLIARHLERLRRSLASLGLASPRGLSGLPADVEALARRAGRPSALARITATAGPVGGGPAGGHLYALLRAVPPRPAAGAVRVGVVPFAHEGRSPVAGVKSTSYLVHYLLRERAEAEGRYEDLMVDESGEVREGTVSNVFAVCSGRLLTPPLEAGVLAGVTRGLALELAAGLDVPAEERALTLAQLAGADEVFLTGAGKGLVGVDELVGHGRYGDARPVTTALRAALAARVAAECGVAPREVDV